MGLVSEFEMFLGAVYSIDGGVGEAMVEGS